MLLILFKVLPSLLLRILGLGRIPNKTLGLGKIIIIQPKDPYSNLVVPYLFGFASPLLLFFFSSSSSSSSSSLFLFSPSTIFSLQNETNFGLIQMGLLRPCLAFTF